jgi:hypothetical protein
MTRHHFHESLLPDVVQIDFHVTFKRLTVPCFLCQVEYKTPITARKIKTLTLQTGP